MKKGMTLREKVMLCILGVLCVILVYYYVFYIPMQNEIAQLKAEYTTLDDSLLVVEAKTTRLAKMKNELEEIKKGNMDEIKELPAFDNRQNLMSELSHILADTESYNITFGKIVEDGTSISRQIRLDYSCESYEAVKVILQKICDGKYPCAFGNMYLSENGASVSVDITYFEYK